MPRSSARASAALLILAALAAALLAGCGGSSSSATSSSGRLNVVAAENFWGSIAAQLGGDRVQVTSMITNPATDPHDYEPTAADARTIAGAQMAIVNGIGYDPWAPKLIAANPARGGIVLTVGDLVGMKPGGNPHRWYSPTDVQKVIDQITADYSKARPRHAAYFERQRATLRDARPRALPGLIAPIKRTLRRRPGRRLGEHLRAARAGARPATC